MKIRSFALAAIAGLLFNIAGFAVEASRGDGSGAVKPQSSRLLSLLPASDGVMVFDTKRFLDDAMPRLLAANQPILDQATSKIAELETQTGIDLRKFEQVAVGITLKQNAEKKFDAEPVVLAGGDINAGALIAMAKIASKGKYREERIGETPVYIFTLPKSKKTAKTAPASKKSKIASVVDQGMNQLATDVAVASLDRNTLAIGTLARVRETIEAASRVSPELIGLLSVKETAVASFAFKTPAGVSQKFGLDNDEIGANIDSIGYLAGSLDVAAVGTTLNLMARTANPEQAAVLKDTLDALQILGKAMLKGSKKPDNAIYGRMVRNAKIGLNGNDVTLELLVPQADIDVLVAKIK